MMKNYEQRNKCNIKRGNCSETSKNSVVCVYKQEKYVLILSKMTGWKPYGDKTRVRAKVHFVCCKARPSSSL